MKPRQLASKAAKIILPLGISGGLVVWLFHKIDLHQISQVIHQGVDYRFIVAMMIVTILSHTIRGIRWGIQLRAAGIPRIPTMAECVSIYSAYALNLVVPYIGEAWRCVYISRRENVKLSTVVGTDLGDRASDGLMILALVILSVIVARPELNSFLDRYPVGEAIERHLTDGFFWLWIVVALMMLAVAGRIFRNTRFVEGVETSARRIWQGFAVLFHMKGTGLYILLTFGIWICYYLETYLCFFAFPFTRELITSAHGYALGLLPGLVVFVFGSCSMAVPSNGGLGAWNLAVMFALSLFGISDSDGAAYSLICWSFQAATLVALGLFSAVYIARGRRKSSPPTP
ncbi:MAG: flippase-like domain-containing protein [Clostridium sp.]|nr:flippase-like domain-containing protein [Clostridium sp.]